MGAKISQLKESQLFSGLTDVDLQKIVAIAKPRKFNANELIFSQGDPAAGFYLIASGAVRIFQISSGGKEHMLHVFRKGESFAEAAALGCGIFPASAETLEESELILIPTSAFKKILAENPSLSINIIGKLSSLLHMFVEKIESLTLKDAGTRLAEYLVNLAKNSGSISEKKVTIKLPLTKGSLAKELNMTQETFSRVLAKFKAGHHISVAGNEITIENMKSLQEVIGSSPI